MSRAEDDATYLVLFIVITAVILSLGRYAGLI